MAETPIRRPRVPTKAELNERLRIRHLLIDQEEERLHDERDWLYILGRDVNLELRDDDHVHLTMIGKLLEGP